MNAKIPKSFNVLAHTVHIRLLSESALKAEAKLKKYKAAINDEICGMYLHENHTIYLSKSLTGTELEQTFLHEKMHCLLESCGKSNLSQNEGFVDLLSELLYQTIVTAKGNTR